MFSLKFADVELGVCRKELNSDIPPTHGYPQQVEYDFGDFGHGDEEGGFVKILVTIQNYGDAALADNAAADVENVAATSRRRTGLKKRKRRHLEVFDGGFSDKILSSHSQTQ